MNHRQLTLKLKNPEKCAGNILFVTHKKMFYNLARYCDGKPEIIRWMYMVTAGTYKGTDSEQSANFDFMAETVEKKYYIKYVSVVKLDKQQEEELAVLRKYATDKGLTMVEVNEMDYKFLG